MKKTILFIFLSAIFFITAPAQLYTVKGKVIDKNTKATLPFVNLIVTGHPQVGTTADIDGNFNLSAPFPITSISFTYVGYHDLVLPIKDSSHNTQIIVALQQEAYQLNEVKILPGINPALRIIETAVRNKDLNNPEKVHSFTYYSYNKLYCTADMRAPTDTLNTLDTAHAKKPANDTAKKKGETMADFFKSQYLFLIESVSKRRFLYPSNNFEEVIAERTSGLKDSPFALLAEQMQSFSFYPEYINVLGEDYLSPLSEAGMKRYNYILEDTLFQGKDSVFVISFHPKKHTTFDGMKGVLYINSKGYAIQNVIAEPIRENSSITINIQQKYEYIDNKQWFPVQLNTDWIYNKIALNDSLTDPHSPHYHVKVVTRSYVKDIVLDTLLHRRDFGRVEVEIAPDASKKQEDFWNKYRNDTLSAKEKKTYHVIDSLGQAIHLDKKLKWLETLSSGKIRIGVLDWDLDRILPTYNGYEKFRFGAGFHTNDRISSIVSIGGYGAYGTGDGAFKYGGDVGFLFDRYSEFKLDFEYTHDVIAAGGVSFYNDDPGLLSPQSYSDYFIENMDKIEEEKVNLSFDALRYFQFNLFGDEQMRQVTNEYEFGVSEGNATLLYNNFQFVELGVGLRFAYKEKFLKGPLGMISLGTEYPVVWANITKGFNDLLNGEFSYLKYDVKMSKSFHLGEAGYSNIQVLAGYVDGNVPYTLLYNIPASYVPNSLVADNTFETMRINEFAASRYACIFYTHSFKSFFHVHSFKPYIEVVDNMGWGHMDYPDSHYFFAFKTMDNGYYESGLEINDLLSMNFMSLGIGGFYRYGPYTFSSPIDNFVAKFTTRFVF